MKEGRAKQVSRGHGVLRVDCMNSTYKLDCDQWGHHNIITRSNDNVNALTQIM